VDFRDALKTYQSLPFDQHVRENIMYNNAAKLLGLAPVTSNTSPSATAPNKDDSVHDLVSDIVNEVLVRLEKQ